MRECLGSALAESGPGCQVVVVDDGSTDGGHEEVPDDPRITWIQRPAEGIVSALEAGRAACIHPFIARLDVDDVALRGRLHMQQAFLAANPGVAVVGGQADLIRHEQCSNEGMSLYVDWVNGLEDLHREILVESPLFHPAVLMRADAVEAVGGYQHGDIPEDYDLWLRLVSAGYSLGAVRQRVVRIRDRPGRLTRTDPRYSLEAFDRVKRAWLGNGPLRSTQRVALWGAGRTGKRWLRWLLAEGHDVCAVVDPFCNTERQGIKVQPPSALSGLDTDVLLVAVGARGARPEIRSQLGAIRPDWSEGRDWWFLA